MECVCARPPAWVRAKQAPHLIKSLAHIDNWRIVIANHWSAWIQGWHTGGWSFCAACPLPPSLCNTQDGDGATRVSNPAAAGNLGSCQAHAALRTHCVHKAGYNVSRGFGSVGLASFTSACTLAHLELTSGCLAVILAIHQVQFWCTCGDMHGNEHQGPCLQHTAAFVSPHGGVQPPAWPSTVMPPDHCIGSDWSDLETTCQCTRRPSDHSFYHCLRLQ